MIRAPPRRSRLVTLFPASRRRALIALVLITLIWSYNWIVMKQVLRDIGPFDFSALRYVLGSGVLFLALLLRREALRPPPLLPTAVIGLAQTTGFQALAQWALVGGGAGKTALLAYTMPFWVVLLGWALFGERPGARLWLSLGVAAFGLLLVLAPWFGFGDANSSLLALVGGACWALGVVLTKRLFRRGGVSALSLTAWQMLIGSLGLVAIALATHSRVIVWSDYLAVGAGLQCGAVVRPRLADVVLRGRPAAGADCRPVQSGGAGGRHRFCLGAARRTAECAGRRRHRAGGGRAGPRDAGVAAQLSGACRVCAPFCVVVLDSAFEGRRRSRCEESPAVNAPSSVFDLPVPHTPAPASTAAPAARPRLDSVDLLRGVVMIVMALDHTRDFFSAAHFDPTDLGQTSAALFLTRWITQACSSTRPKGAWRCSSCTGAGGRLCRATTTPRPPRRPRPHRLERRRREGRDRHLRHLLRHLHGRCRAPKASYGVGTRYERRDELRGDELWLTPGDPDLHWHAVWTSVR